MKRKIKRILGQVLLGQMLTVAAWAQSETVPVQLHNKLGQVEEFNVLKTDKTVRQGNYIRYHMDGPLSGVSVYEVGSYDHGLKEGEWRYFSEQSPWNRLISKGSYRAGLPEGQWFYYQPTTVALASRKAVLNRRSANEGFTIATDDTAAVVQAKGFCIKGERAGLWKYYDADGTLIQAINHSNKQLWYWQPAVGQVISGEALTANHPLLYVGGKTQLKHDILHSIDLKALLESGKTASTGMVFCVDSTGRQTSIELTTKTAPDKYERLLLAQLTKIPTRWLPRLANSQPMAAKYYVLVTTTNEDNRMAATVETFDE